MSVPAEKGEPPPEGETVCCHHALYKKEVGLIMGILGNFVSTRDTDPFSDRERASELQVVLEEMEMIWQYCDTSTQFVLSENAINVNGALGLLCEFLYRIARGTYTTVCSVVVCMLWLSLVGQNGLVTMGHFFVILPYLASGKRWSTETEVRKQKYQKVFAMWHTVYNVSYPLWQTQLFQYSSLKKHLFKPSISIA